jgi:glycosyltransferase involved in cell wall biosynthesis
MRVLFVDQFSEFGGAQLGLRDIMAEGVERGWESWFAAPGNGGLFDYCGSSGISPHSLPLGTYRNGSKSPGDLARYLFDMSRSARSVSEIIRRNRIDLVYVNGPRVLAAAAGVRCPLVFHLHSFLDKVYSRAVAGWVLRHRRGTVIAASYFVARALRTVLSASSIRVVYNGVRDLGFAPRPRRSRATTVGIIGRIAPEKGHLDLLRAAGLMAANGRDVRLVIAGASLFSDPAYAARVRAMASGARVEFRGWTDDVASILHEIDILAAPSAGSECSPRILLEAFSAGTPVVAYPSGGIPELVRDGVTGLLTARAHADDLAAAIAKLAADRALMARLSSNGRREWESRFGVARFRNEIADIVELSGSVEGRQSEAAAAVAGDDYLSPRGVPRG